MTENIKFSITLPTLICTLLFPATLYSQPGTISTGLPVQPLPTGSHLDTTPSLLRSLSEKSAASTSPHAASAAERQSAVRSLLDTQFDFSPALEASNIPHNLVIAASPDATITVSPRPGNDPTSAMNGDAPRPPAWTTSFRTTTINAVPTNPSKPTAQGDRLSTQLTPSLSEWYINSPRGIEHGYTVTAPPDLSDNLRADITLTTDLTPSLESDTVTFTNAAGKTSVSYSHLVVNDATGRRLPAHLELVGASPGTHILSIVTDTTGAIYPVTIDPILTTEGDVLTPSDNSPGSFTGIATATTDTISVTGAPFNGGAGAAYVYEKDHPTSAAWGEVKRLTHPDGNQFGRSVAITGTTVFVGSPGNNTVYVFERDHGGAKNYGLVTSLTPTSTTPFDNYGWHMAAHGDTLAVGASGDVSGGGVYVYQRDPSAPLTWNPVGTTPLRASDAASGDLFGNAVSVSEDTIVVGAPNKAINGHSQAGAAYVFSRQPNGIWTETQRLTHEDPQAGDQFGFAVSNAGDFIAIGAPFDDVNPDDAGSVHTYRRSAALALFLFATLVVMPTLQANALFGHAVGITWLGELFVGAHQATDAGISSGLAFIFNFSTVLLTFVFASVIKSAVRANGQFFAYNIAIAATVILLGSPFLNNATGGAYRFDLAAQSLTFAQWLPLFFAGAVLNNLALQATVWGPLADPNGDGFSNLIEYLVGGNPLAIGTSPLVALTLLSSVVLTLSLARYVSGYRAQLQFAQLLRTWVDFGTGFASQFRLVLLAAGVQGSRYQLILPIFAFVALQMRLAAVPE